MLFCTKTFDCDTIKTMIENLLKIALFAHFIKIFGLFDPENVMSMLYTYGILSLHYQ